MKKGLVFLLAFMVVAALASPLLMMTAGAEENSYLAEGSVTGTGATINVSIGFKPRYVIVSNVTTTSPVKVEWWQGMTAASCLKSLASVTAANIVSSVTVSCISQYAGSLSAARGFTIGADTDLNITGDTLRYSAFK